MSSTRNGERGERADAGERDYAARLRFQTVVEYKIPADAKEHMDALNDDMVKELAPKEPGDDDKFQDHIITMVVIAGIGILFIMPSFARLPDYDQAVHFMGHSRTR
jgi:hypothetical protein